MVKIKFVDGNAVVSGEFNFGYMGIHKDEQIEIYGDIDEIRDWDIVTEHFEGDFTDEQLADFLTEYFNNFEAKIQANIKQVNDNFLIKLYEYGMEGIGRKFWEAPEITNAEYLPEDMTDFDPYTFCEETWKISDEYDNTPNDGSLQKTDVEKFLREKIPLFNIDAFLAGIVPEGMSFDDGRITFQCSDSLDFEHQILCNAYDELDETLTFCDWHNF
ncbi:MAG: hypothetical protein NC340_02975 [Ruminococcus flavefaciens]|nr:hypothetical protein [Ruminococcus flavefaciens]MCM1229464.1 hypothetical protein [Ruminococcus flavefaciens]